MYGPQVPPHKLKKNVPVFLFSSFNHQKKKNVTVCSGNQSNPLIFANYFPPCLVFVSTFHELNSQQTFLGVS